MREAARPLRPPLAPPGPVVAAAPMVPATGAHQRPRSRLAKSGISESAAAFGPERHRRHPSAPARPWRNGEARRAHGRALAAAPAAAAGRARLTPRAPRRPTMQLHAKALNPHAGFAPAAPR